MPRLEDGELLTSANKFKKRRAWIAPDGESLPMAESIAPEPLIVSKQVSKNPLIETRMEHDYNKSATRLEHERNNSITRAEQEISHNNAISQASKTRVEHDYNKSITNINLKDLYGFIDGQRASLASYEDEPKCIILSLSDVQKKIFWCTVIECITRGASRTGPTEIKKFFGNLDISTAVVITTLNRLVDKRIMLREKGKLGKNGCAIISLSKMMFDAAKEIFTDFKALGSL